MIKLQEFIDKHGVTAEIQRTNTNPNWAGENEGFHWTVQLKRADATLDTFFTTGFGLIEDRKGNHVQGYFDPDKKMMVPRKWGGQVVTIYEAEQATRNWRVSVPSVADVLDCLASDSAGYENSRSFEDWCGEYGYDEDSRRAERVYRVCAEQAKALKFLLGHDAFEELLWETERE